MALRLNPYHFAAAANLGHTYVEEGDVLSALRYYRYALRIHPRLADLREAVRSIEAAQAKRSHRDRRAAGGQPWRRFCSLAVRLIPFITGI